MRILTWGLTPNLILFRKVYTEGDLNFNVKIITIKSTGQKR